MGMKEWLPVAPAGDRQGEADQIRAVKRAEDLSARLRGDDEKWDGDNVDVRGFPDFAFYSDAGFEFLESVASAGPGCR